MGSFSLNSPGDDSSRVLAEGATTLDYLGTRFGEEILADSPEILRVLDHILFACLVRINTGRIDRDTAVRDLRLAARLLLAGASPDQS